MSEQPLLRLRHADPVSCRMVQLIKVLAKAQTIPPRLSASPRGSTAGPGCRTVSPRPAGALGLAGQISFALIPQASQARG